MNFCIEGQRVIIEDKLYDEVVKLINRGENGLGKSEAKYCENDMVMTKEVYEELGKAETWTKVKGYSNYELSSFGNIRNATTLKEVAIKWKTNGVPYVMLYNRKLGRSIRVYIKDIK